MPNIILKINGMDLRMGQDSPQYTLESISQMGRETAAAKCWLSQTLPREYESW